MALSPRIAHWPPDLTAAMDGDGASLKQVCVTAGHISPRHSHPHEQFVVVVSGAGTLECDAGPVDLRPGTVLHFPANAWHSAAFSQATVLLEVNFSQS